MNKIFKIGIIGLFSLLFSCDKSSKSIEEGIYSGIFTVEYPLDIVREGWNNSGTITLELKDGKYTYTSDVPPKLFFGTYSISNNKIKFVRDRGIDDPDLSEVPAYFDTNLILYGEYDYTLDEKTLKFSADKYYAGTGKVGHYEYDFIKQ